MSTFIKNTFNLFKAGVLKTRNFVGVNNPKSFYNASIDSKIKGIFNLWVGLGFLIGCNGAIIEHKRIRRYSYNQCMISDFDKFMISFDGHCKAIIIYGLMFMYYPFTRIFLDSSYFEMVDNFRCPKSSWLHSKDIDRYMPEI